MSLPCHCEVSAERLAERRARRFSIDFLVHGDDPTINAAGEDAYAAPKKAGKFKMIKRTEGVQIFCLFSRLRLHTAK